MSQTKPITKAAIIGCNWGMVHLAALQQSGLELSALVDVDLPRAQSLAQQLNIAHACQSLDQVPEVDLVIEGNFGILPVEIKLNTVIKQRELRGLKNFIDDMKCPYGFVINRGKRIEMLTDKIVQIPVHYL